MFTQKFRDLLDKVIGYVNGFFARPEVQDAISQAKQVAKEVADWLSRTITANPEAAMAGAIVALVMLTARSTFTMGLLLKVLFICAVATGAHYYFINKQSEVAKAPGH